MREADVSKFDGRLLKLFLTVYDTGSVSRAADLLDLNQSTVSHGLDRLRSGLGDPLFVKFGRGIRPTEFAAFVAPTIREIVALLEGLRQKRSYDPSKDDKALTIAGNISELIPEIVTLRQSIALQAPQLELRFIELGSRENIEPLLETGQADVVITARLTAYSSALCWSDFIHDRNVCFFDSRRRGPVASIEDYASAKHAVLDFGGSKLSTVALKLNELSISRNIQLSAPNTYCLAQLMTGTDYVATMQSRLSGSVFRDLSYCEAPVPLPDVYFDLVWHKRSDASPRNQWIRELVSRSKRLAPPAG